MDKFLKETDPDQLERKGERTSAQKGTWLFSSSIASKCNRIALHNQEKASRKKTHCDARFCEKQPYTARLTVAARQQTHLKERG